MKFVHLAPLSAVPRIRRNGLRIGKGRRGAGVYAVPLVNIRRRSVIDPEDFNYLSPASQMSEPISSIPLWRYLFAQASMRSRRPVAVIFTVPRPLWPVDLYLEVAPVWAAHFCNSLNQIGEGIDVLHDSLDLIDQAAAQGFLADLHVRVGNARILGQIINAYFEAGASVLDNHSDSIEVVIPLSVPASAIEKLIPLSKTSRHPKHSQNPSEEEDL